MAMAGMGGPVGTPTNSTTPYSPEAIIKKLNTHIYEYLLCNGHYESARAVYKDLPIEENTKQSPGQRQNGADSGMDIDSKELPGVQKRPSDLPAPDSMSHAESPFLQDWWCQFWELFHGNRQRGKPTVLGYVGQQRVAQKARTGMLVDPNGMQRGYNMMNNGDMRQAALKNGMSPAQQAQLQSMKMRTGQGQGNQMQSSQMERSSSQMEMGGPRSGSPINGDAPSPKRARLDGNMPQMPQARPGQPGQMPAGSQGMPQNPQMGPGGGAQSSPMSQPGLDGNSTEFYANQRMGMPQNGVPVAAPGQQGANNGNGNHALQDYQMQLMLLEQQNKKRLLMARQEQDSMAHPTGPNGAAFQPGMSPSNSRAGDPSPNPNEMQRGTPNIKKAGMSPPNGDMAGRGSPAPNMMDPAMRQQMMAMGPNGQPLMRPAPSSHPAMGGQMSQQQMEYMQRGGQMMPNGGWQGGPQPPHGMMPQPGQPGQQPNMTPRQGNMPPPPAPPVANAGGTQPSSPAQQPQPPTPSQANKPKPGGKKDNKKGGNKKGAAAATNEGADAPPTPTPPPPVTPNNAASFNQNKNLQMQNGQPGPGAQQNHNGNQVQAPAPDMGMGAPFGDLGGDGQFTGMDFANLDSGDVLDNFDFDSFLNNNDDAGLAFDANFAFGGDASIETDIGGN